MELRRYTRLDQSLSAAVRALAADAAAVDGSPALNDAALLALSRPGQHLVGLDEKGGLMAYAQVAGSTAQLVVAVSARLRGCGTALVEAVVQAGARFAWAFGNTPGAQALAAHRQAHQVRALVLMHRDLGAELLEVDEPAGVTFRSFVPGEDDAGWLAVNARAFAHHPEQGQMSGADLEARMAADWFDPAGFILAVGGPGTDRAGQLLGFHWTKSVSDQTGEVYALGVDPDVDGHGLGKALLRRGLLHLRDTGHLEVILYVEADQPRAVKLYNWYGFTEQGRDCMYGWT